MASLLVCCLVVLAISPLAYGVTIEINSTGTSLALLVLGDWGRKGASNQTAVASTMGVIAGNIGAKFVISDGDNFYDSGLTGTSDPAFSQSFTNIYTATSLNVPWYVCLGNHDYKGDALAQIDPALKARDSLWNCLKSFNLRHKLCSSTGVCQSLVEFFFVDTTPFVASYWNSSTFYDWRGVTPRDAYMKNQTDTLNNSLSASTSVWKIVVGHHPIRSVGEHGDTPELQTTILPLLNTYNVDAYVNGHDHCLEDIKSLDSNLRFFTSGGGSAAWRGIDNSANMSGLQLYYDGQGFISMQITTTSLVTNFYTINGSVIHTATLTK